MKIAADEHWVHTGYRVVAGTSYRLTATGTWMDRAKSATADGYDSSEYPTRFSRAALRLTQWARRVPRARWMTLIAVIGTDRSTPYIVGSFATITPERDGELLCFANDVWIAYGNNKGAVDLTVRVLEDG